MYEREGGFDAHKQLAFLSKYEVTNVFSTPTAIRSMMSIDDAGTRYPQRFRIVCAAGEPLNPEAIRWFREQYGVTILDFYGLSESYPLCANFPFMEVREGSMGRPTPGWDVAILDEDEQPVPPGERGEICLRARSNPHYPLGYWNNEEAARETFGGAWFHTKDAARMDADGYVWYEGRADDVIIAAGYRIGPFEVESACLEHPAVAEAAAVASPDERRGSVVKAFIVLAEGHQPSEELAKGIQTHVRNRLSAYHYPRLVEFVPSLPKTLTGKIRRIELREAEARRVARSGGRVGGSWRRSCCDLGGSRRRRTVVHAMTVARPAAQAAPRPTFAEVAEEHLDDVFGYLAYLTRDRGQAEDLASSTFEKALRLWERFDPQRGSPRTWLLGIARTTALDWFRAEARRRKREEAAALPERVDEAFVEGLSPALEAALATLSAGEREVLALRVVLELDGDATARVLGISPTAVSTRLSRALKRLEERVSEG